MDSVLVSKSVLVGILAGNEKMAQWSGGDWVCDRQNTEFALVSSVADELHARLPAWQIWPETTAGADFKHVETDYYRRVSDCIPVSIFGGVRYDLGLLRSPDRIAALFEFKRYWGHDFYDPTKLSRVLYYLGIEPGRESGIALEAVFFGAFVWHDPKAADGCRDTLEAQFALIESEVNAWWTTAMTGGGIPIQEAFGRKYGISPVLQIFHDSRAGTGTKSAWEMGAVCVSLSLQ